MQKFILISVLLAISGLQAACTNLQFPGVYKLAIEQGNIITQEMVDQLKPGMSREQVEYILGSPMIRDTFNESRWDYVYTIQRGDNPRSQQHITVYFSGNKLKSFSGDFLPSQDTAQL